MPHQTGRSKAAGNPPHVCLNLLGCSAVPLSSHSIHFLLPTSTPTLRVLIFGSVPQLFQPPEVRRLNRTAGVRQQRAGRQLSICWQLPEGQVRVDLGSDALVMWRDDLAPVAPA